jgi:hypothetical protein
MPAKNLRDENLFRLYDKVRTQVEIDHGPAHSAYAIWLPTAARSLARLALATMMESERAIR